MKYYATALSENMHETPEGFLLCVAVPIARIGDMEYSKDEVPIEAGNNGTVTISRDDKEVFRPETIASFEGKPFTIGHPENFVDTKNWKDLAKGHMSNVRKGTGADSQNLVCDLLITDALAISLVKNGLRGLSCGYEAEYIQTGVGKGKQTDIIGNHLALVEEGRAGPTYAINDEKGVVRMSKKLADKIKTMFSKVVDEAVKDEDPPTPKKEEKAKDAAAMYDDLVKLCDALGAKIASMKPSGDADKEDDPPKEEKGKDAEVGAGLEDRLKALEMAVQKLMEGESEEAVVDAEEEEAEDEAEPDDVTDADEPKLVGDTASRVEILAPGLKATKDVKVKALKVAYATKDGKAVIDSLTNGKAPAYENADKVDMLFNAASELLKVKRSSDFAKTKTGDSSSGAVATGYKSAEEMNEINAKFYNQSK